MASANPIWKRWATGLLASAKAQPLATALLFPLALLSAQVWTQRQDAIAARQHASIDSLLSQVRASGKELDTAIASYYDAISELGLAERKIKSPGTYALKSVGVAQADVVAARKAAQKALSQHASDVHGLGRVAYTASGRKYMSELGEISDIVDGQTSIEQTSNNITVFGKLIAARDSFVNEASRS